MDEYQPIAHTKNHAGVRQLLSEHTYSVAALAEQFAEPFEGGEFARLAGLLHDIGKYNPQFQRYLLDAENHLPAHSVDHKGAGSVLAQQMNMEPLAFLVAGHHGGMPSKADLKIWLQERRANPEVSAAIVTAQRNIPELQTKTAIKIPDGVKQNKQSTELFLRMTFSALADADFLDTEQHFADDNSAARQEPYSLEKYWNVFQENQQMFTETKTGLLHDIRKTIYTYCVDRASDAPGCFRLTAPTGSGKTRSSLAFALKHGCLHHKNRIIYALPYTSITEQTADVFRDIFRDMPNAVLEHHSAATYWKEKTNSDSEPQWLRLASENWDAGIIVTTTVQLFESLFARTPSMCRKLHNIAGSVIVLDEAQLLPLQLLQPILHVLKQLIALYQVTVVVCSATQPAFRARENFDGIGHITEIIPDAQNYFAALKRVTYHWPEHNTSISWENLASRIIAEKQSLTIVNTRKDAVALARIIGENRDDLFHLSTFMCGAHRKSTLKTIKNRLEQNLPCHLVATQVIEAGVDVDFAVGFRAMAPLDSIVQAAGRVNREGKLPFGNMHIFLPEEHTLPTGVYKIGADITAALHTSFDMYHPDTYEHYFAELYRHIDIDQPKIRQLQESFDFPAVAERFSMIPKDAFPVLVIDSAAGNTKFAEAALAELQHNQYAARKILRKLQPYLVNLHFFDIKTAVERSSVAEIIPGLWRWLGVYHPLFGVDLDSFLNPELGIF